MNIHDSTSDELWQWWKVSFNTGEATVGNTNTQVLLILTPQLHKDMKETITACSAKAK
jgi:hypothetical protein